MVSNHPGAARIAESVPLAARRPADPVRPCTTCRRAATCQVARYTDGDVAICSLWEEQKPAA